MNVESSGLCHLLERAEGHKIIFLLRAEECQTLATVNTGMVEHENDCLRQDREETSRVDWEKLTKGGCAPVREGWRPVPSM